MHAIDAIKQGQTLLHEHGLDDWQMTVNYRAKARGGCCKYGKKLIEVSAFRLDDTDAVVLNTLLHEIAHAKVGAGHRHDYVWREFFRSIGGNGKVTSAAVNAPRGRYQATCRGCGVVHQWHRRTRRRYRCNCKHPDILLIFDSVTGRPI